MRAKKSLGQHFLTDPVLLARIAAATGAGPDDVVLEIGPGLGGLTAPLLDLGATVVAIEQDERMFGALRRRFADRDLVLASGDALKMDWPGLVEPWTTLGKPWRVAGNIPYYITSPLLDKALTAPLPASITFLVQKEVADRVVAPAGHDDYGALSVGIQALSIPKRSFAVSRGAFTPPPKVDSAVLHLVPRIEPLVPAEQIPAFRKLVTSLFSYRRKKMRRALREALGVGPELAAEMLAQSGIDLDVRPEVVTPEQFVALLGLTSGVRDRESVSS